MSLEHYELVETPDSLLRALESLADLDQVGADVERADWDRYWRAAALLQIGGDGRVMLIDPLALTELEPLAEFLSTRLTVLHAMENDYGPMASLGVAPPQVEDTAIAAAMLGLPTGLETLLADLLDVHLEGDKAAMQRANWEQRPLDEDMLRYAAGDVADLPALWQELETRLEEAGRTHWYRQELDAAINLPSAPDRRDWTRTKGSGRLDPAARARLRVLWDRREELARETDTAPGRILTDKQMVELSLHPATTPAELVSRGMRRPAVREHGAALLQALADGANAAREPVPRSHRQVSEQDRTLVDQLRVRRAKFAKALGIDSGILCPSRTLMAAVAADPEDPATLRAVLGLRPWQWEILGHDFCEILQIDGPGLPETRPDLDLPDDDDEEMSDPDE